MRDMSEAEWSEFIRYGTRTGKLAINLRSGRATVASIWFLYESDGVIRFNTGGGTAKAQALRDDPRAYLLVDLEEPPYAYVRMDTTVRMVEDATLTLRVATEIGARYMGEDRADEYGKRNSVPGEVTVELTPIRVIAVHGVSD